MSYINILRDYKKVLNQKNMALKKNQFNLIPVYNEFLARLGMQIMKMRNEVNEFFNKRMQSLFSHIFSENNKNMCVTMQYAPNWKSYDYTSIMDTLSKQMGREKDLSFSMSGPHKDKILFMLSGYPFKEHASTGQIRIFSLLIRTIQSEYYNTFTGKKCAYLFDDVLLELDKVKRALFLQVLPKGIQNFFTFLPDEKIPDQFLSDSCIYQVKNGTIKKQ